MLNEREEFNSCSFYEGVSGTILAPATGNGDLACAERSTLRGSALTATVSTFEKARVDDETAQEGTRNLHSQVPLAVYL